MNYENNVHRPGKKAGNPFKEIAEWIATIVFALLVAMLIKGFLFVPIEVKMVSMQDTLFEGQRLIVYKLGYFFDPPKRGDIVIFEHQEGMFRGWLKYLPLPNPQEIDYIKRVIALPGDEIDVRDSRIYINGKEYPEPYAKGYTDTMGMELPVTVPENKIFVMGDNREHSSDSRQLGFIDLDKVRGKAVFRIWPLNVAGPVK